MTQDELDDHVKGAPLAAVVLHLLEAVPAKSFQTQALYRNKETGGFFTLPARERFATIQLYVPSNFLHVSLIDRRDQTALLTLARGTALMAAFEDWLTHDLTTEFTDSLTAALLTSAEETLLSAISEIARLQPPETEIQVDMALKGTLHKCVNYMALLFSQHGYEFLNIAFNMGTKEYELLTPAEVTTMKNADRWGDRRIVLTCTIYELEKLTTSPQLKLELPNVQKADTQNSKDRELPPHQSTD